MLWLLAPLVLLVSVPPVNAGIYVDRNCSTMTPVYGWVHSPSATMCSNTLSDATCAALYPFVNGAIAPGNTNDRNPKCYTTGDKTGAIVQDLKNVAVEQCPKQCGFCCLNSAYSCSNVQFPRLNCATITQSQCLSSQWRTIIAQDCPSACGFCKSGGCVDAILDCTNDISICNAVGMQTFVNTYCQRTCGRCSSTTTVGVVSSVGCSSYIADTSTSCRAWAVNGFCTNTFYTLLQRKAYCATTCRIC